MQCFWIGPPAFAAGHESPGEGFDWADESSEGRGVQFTKTSLQLLPLDSVQMLHIPCPALPVARTAELTKRIKESDGWFKSLESTKGLLDFTSLDEKGMGRLWFLSHAKSQEFTKIIINTLKSQVIGELF
jgi:hypothetical protein